MCIVFGMKARRKESRGLEMERLGVTQPLMMVFKVNIFTQLELREVIFVVGKRSSHSRYPLIFYFSCFILIFFMK